VLIIANCINKRTISKTTGATRWTREKIKIFIKELRLTPEEQAKAGSDLTTNLITECPAGHTPTRTGTSGGQTPAHFLLEACANCELLGLCYSKKRSKDYVVRISLKAVNTGRKEGSHLALKRTGLYKLNVCGRVKSTVVCGLKIPVQNIKRFIKFIQGGYKPKESKIPPRGYLCPFLADREYREQKTTTYISIELFLILVIVNGY
jgi:hypothetical protein